MFLKTSFPSFSSQQSIFENVMSFKNTVPKKTQTINNPQQQQKRSKMEHQL